MSNLPAAALNLLNHPAFQSLLLPLLLAVLGMAALFGLQRLWATGSKGADGHKSAHLAWVPAGSVLGLLVPMLLLTGLHWPALANSMAHTQKLPWIVLAGLAVALWSATRGLHAAQPGNGVMATWLAPAVLWLLACFWLAGDVVGWWPTAWAALAGLLVLALLAGTKECATGPVAAATVSMAAAGLALLIANGGSLLLAQLAMMLACSAAVPGLWAWLRPASALQVQGWLLQLQGLTWLALGWAWILSTPGSTPGPALATAAPLAVLALAFAAPLLWRGRSTKSRWLPLLAALSASAAAALALGLQLYLAAQATSSLPASSDSAAPSDDPYFTPRWP